MQIWSCIRWNICAAVRLVLLPIRSIVILKSGIVPDMELLVPTDGQEAWIFNSWLLIEIVTELDFGVIDADETGYLCVNFWLAIDRRRITLASALRVVSLLFLFFFGGSLIVNYWLYLSAHKVLQGLTVRKVPNVNLAISSWGDQPSTPHIESTSGNLWVVLLVSLYVATWWSLELGHQLSVLNVPNWNETVVVSWDYGIELVIVTGKWNGSLMTSFDFLLGLEGPELDHSWANDDIVGDWVIS